MIVIGFLLIGKEKKWTREVLSGGGTREIPRWRKRIRFFKRLILRYLTAYCFRVDCILIVKHCLNVLSFGTFWGEEVLHSHGVLL